jgi:hypothetical protein
MKTNSANSVTGSVQFVQHTTPQIRKIPSLNTNPLRFVHSHFVFLFSKQIYLTDYNYNVCRIVTITVKPCKPSRNLYACNTNSLGIQDGYKRMQEAPKMAMKSSTQYLYSLYPTHLPLSL